MPLWFESPGQNCPGGCSSRIQAFRNMLAIAKGMMRIFACLIMGMSLVISSGCSKKVKAVPVGTVSGTVMIKGKPLEIGRLNFVSGEIGAGASGVLGPDGKYALDGPLVTGTYDVFVTFELSPVQFKSPAAGVLKSVPQKYQKQHSSKLVAKVEEGPNSHNFDLK